MGGGGGKAIYDRLLIFPPADLLFIMVYFTSTIHNILGLQ